MLDGSVESALIGNGIDVEGSGSLMSTGTGLIEGGHGVGGAVVRICDVRRRVDGLMEYEVRGACWVLL